MKWQSEDVSQGCDEIMREKTQKTPENERGGSGIVNGTIKDHRGA